MYELVDRMEVILSSRVRLMVFILDMPQLY